MAESWGNGDQTKFDENLVSDPDYFNVLKVNDVHDTENPEVARVAVHAVNSGTNAIDRALKVEGKTEIAGQTTMDKDINGTAVQITNSNVGGSAKALVVVGKTLLTETQIQGNLNVDTIDADVDVYAANRIKVGQDEVNGGRIDYWAKGGTPYDLKIGTDSQETRDVTLSRSGRKTDVRGNLEVQENSLLYGTLDLRGETLTLGHAGAHIETSAAQELKLGTENETSTGVIISRDGKSTNVRSQLLVNNILNLRRVEVEEVDHGKIDAAGPLSLGTENTTTEVNLGRAGNQVNVAEALILKKVSNAGRIDAEGWVEVGADESTTGVAIGRSGSAAGVIIESPALTIKGDTFTSGAIEGDGTAQDPVDVVIGADSNHSGNVNLSRAGKDVNVADDLNVGGNLDVTGNGQVDGNLDVDGTIVVGPGNNPGKIDAANSRDLNLGGEASTANVVLGHVNQNVLVPADSLQVTGGPLKVGPTGDPGQIDSGGVELAETDLTIGAGPGTADVLLGRVNQLVQLLTTLRINGNRIELDDAGNAWIEFHPRELPGFSSIDFATEGQVRFYVDRDGGHNA